MRQRDLLMPAQWADNGCMNDRPRALHLKACRFGVTVLKVFWWTTLVAVIALAAALAAVIAGPWPIGPWLGCTAVVAAVETIVFWTGIVTVYLSSVQLGLKWRVIGVLCGWIPIANLIALRRIIRNRRARSHLRNGQGTAERQSRATTRLRHPIPDPAGARRLLPRFQPAQLLGASARRAGTQRRHRAVRQPPIRRSVPDSARELPNASAASWPKQGAAKSTSSPTPRAGWTSGTRSHGTASDHWSPR